MLPKREHALRAPDASSVKEELLELLHNDDETTECLVDMLDFGPPADIRSVQRLLDELASEGQVTSYTAIYADRSKMADMTWWSLVQHSGPLAPARQDGSAGQGGRRSPRDAG